MKTELKVTCKDCLFFKNLIHPCEHFTCETAGFLEYSSPCQNFCVNFDELNLLYTDNKDIISYIRKVPKNELTRLSALLIQEGYNRTKGWSIGDLAYFNLGKTDYISSYVQVVFKGYDPNTGFAMVDGTKPGFSSYLNIKCPLSHLLTEEQWREKHKELVKEGRINDHSLDAMLPGYEYHSDEEMKQDDYVPDNIVLLFVHQKQQSA